MLVTGYVGKYLDFALFQPVDFVVDGFQFGLVRGAEIAAAGVCGHFAQGLFVDFDLLLHERPVAEHVDRRIGSHALCADADGINADTLRLGDFGGSQRSDFTAVVHAIGQQDDDLRFGLALAQAVDGRGEPVAGLSLLPL